MSEEENERDFMKACFNAVAGLEVKNESQAIAKEVILDEVENLTKENKQLKEVIDKAINNSQYWIDYYTRLNSDERIALRLQENIDILKEIKNENKDTRI